MDSLIMFRTRLMSAVLVGVISSFLGLAPPASATEGDAAARGAASLQLAQACGTLGPYATIRRGRLPSGESVPAWHVPRSGFGRRRA